MKIGYFVNEPIFELFHIQNIAQLLNCSIVTSVYFNPEMTKTAYWNSYVMLSIYVIFFCKNTK